MCRVGDSIGWGEISKWRQAFPFCGFGWIIIIIAVAVVILRCYFVSSALLYIIHPSTPKAPSKAAGTVPPDNTAGNKGPGAAGSAPLPSPPSLHPLPVPARGCAEAPHRGGSPLRAAGRGHCLGAARVRGTDRAGWCAGDPSSPAPAEAGSAPVTSIDFRGWTKFPRIFH